MALRLLEGSEAIAEAAIIAGAKFYAGYPMSPATELLEHLARKLPEHGGVCVNGETEIECISMALGASMTGFRAATGSVGQGLALMQESFGEAAFDQTPLVVFNMARNQQDYYQATRGGGWGDYRTITLAPKDIPEAVEHAQLLFHLADKYRAPVIFYGDNLLARTQVSVDIQPIDFGPLPEKDWILDGSSGGSGASRIVNTWGEGKVNTPGPGVQQYWRNIAAKFEEVAAKEMRWEEGYIDDAETVVVSFGTAAKFVEHVVREMRAEGIKIGFFRPITLWPFPGDALALATRRAKNILVFELNAGQMIDDVKIHVDDRRAVRAIGGISCDASGLGLGSFMDAPVIRERIEKTLQGVAL